MSIVRVSAKEGTNIQELRRSIEALIPKIVPKRDTGKPYLPIDRAFGGYTKFKGGKK